MTCIFMKPCLMFHLVRMWPDAMLHVFRAYIIYNCYSSKDSVSQKVSVASISLLPIAI